nr:astacin-like metalloprotease toxin 5 [Parasteatoda tepidariorum]
MSTFVLLFLYSFHHFYCLGLPVEFLGDLPIENPDLFGGDILGIENKEDKNAVIKKIQLWPKGVVPYKKDPGLHSTIENYVLQASFGHYKKHTCINFVLWTNETDYIYLFPGDGCYSYVGKVGGKQPVSLGRGCGWSGTIIHELGHAIGFYHEQNRSDRDDYLTIIWGNIPNGMEDQFFKLKSYENRLLSSFDYDSIMLYGSYAFTKDRKSNLKTMTGINGRFLTDVVSKTQMSKSDIRRVNRLYDC